ncbi:hypothetical protein [Ancylobacter terrae]|uniref:hypothetical protein n=1 Tax=Ancylobacter sp. sgz301288 TaxID=3342077 RepID=UPI00385C9802
MRGIARRLALVTLFAGMALGTAGCESLDKLNPFGEKEKPLPGTRTPVFPEGVPGVDYGAAPPQPASPGGYEPAAPAQPAAPASR